MAARLTPKAAARPSSRACQRRRQERRSATMTAAAARTLSSATPPGASWSNSTAATAAPRYCDTAPTMNSGSGASETGLRIISASQGTSFAARSWPKGRRPVHQQRR